MRQNIAPCILAGTLLALAAVPAATGQGAQERLAQRQQMAQAARRAAIAADPRRETLERVLKPVTIELEDAKLEDVVQFLKDFTGADIEALWIDDRFLEGLDKETLVTISARNQPALDLIERILEKVQSDFSENSWQFTEAGTLEIGPKLRLNRRSRLEVYDIQDLLFVIPNFSEVPELDLDSVLQQAQSGGGGGGGGGSIFEDEDEDMDLEQNQDEAAQELIDLIITFVEPEQWIDNGGDAGSIRFYNGVFLIKAPDYIHRQLQGYSFWPGKTFKPSADRRFTRITPEQETQSPPATAGGSPPSSGGEQHGGE